MKKETDRGDQSNISLPSIDSVPADVLKLTDVNKTLTINGHRSSLGLVSASWMVAFLDDAVS